MLEAETLALKRDHHQSIKSLDDLGGPKQT